MADSRKIDISREFVYAYADRICGRSMIKVEDVEQSKIMHAGLNIINQPKNINTFREFKLLARMIEKLKLQGKVVVGGGSIVCYMLDNIIKDYDIFFIGSKEECIKNSRLLAQALVDELRIRRNPPYNPEDIESDSDTEDSESDSEDSESDSEDSDSEDNKSSSDSEDAYSDSDSEDSSIKLEDSDSDSDSDGYSGYQDNNGIFVMRRRGILKVGKFELILKPYSSMNEIPSSFDLGCCEVYWDGVDVYFSRLAVFVYKYNMLPVFKKMGSHHRFFSRLNKYISRGFTVFLPKINRLTPCINVTRNVRVMQDVVEKDPNRPSPTDIDVLFVFGSVSYGRTIVEPSHKPTEYKISSFEIPVKYRDLIKNPMQRRAWGYGAFQLMMQLVEDRSNLALTLVEYNQADLNPFDWKMRDIEVDILLRDAHPCRIKIPGYGYGTENEHDDDGMRSSSINMKPFYTKFVKNSWARLDACDKKILAKHYINKFQESLDPFEDYNDYTGREMNEEVCHKIIFDCMFWVRRSTLNFDTYIMSKIRSYCCTCSGSSISLCQIQGWF